MKRTLISILCIAALMFILSGCGSQTDASGQESAEVRPKESATAALAAEDTEAVKGTEAIKDADANAGKDANTNTDSSSLIAEEEAKAIALKDAGAAEADISSIRIKLDESDGVQVYEVDFYAGDKEYDYDINASTGEILSMDMEIEDDFSNTAGSNASAQTSVTEEEAKKAALNKVSGASEENIRIHLDYEDGKAVYEGSIVYGGMEYDFEIDADSGKILEWEQEKAD